MAGAEPSPGADVAAVSPVPAQMWEGFLEERGLPSPSALAGLAPNNHAQPAAGLPPRGDAASLLLVARLFALLAAAYPSGELYSA